MGEPFTSEDLARLSDANLATSLHKSLHFLNVLNPQLRAKLPWHFGKSDSRKGWWGWEIVGEEFRRKTIIWVWVGMFIDPWMWYGQSSFWLELDFQAEDQAQALQEHFATKGINAYRRGSRVRFPLKLQVDESLTKQAEAVAEQVKRLLHEVLEAAGAES